jgi:hypothetical protein
MNAQRWEVLTLVGNHWLNVWELDEEPETFASYEEADAALAEHLRDCRYAVNLGHLEDMPTRDEFRIVPHVGILGDLPALCESFRDIERSVGLGHLVKDK